MTRALAALLLAGCYAPTIADGQYSCVADGICPDGLVCTNQCFRCVHPGQPLDDADHCPSADFAGGRADLSIGTADLACPFGGCTDGCANSLGARASGDPGLPSIAFCPAAWSIPGVRAPTTGRPCTSPTGTGCAAADNCAPGWHICRDDGDAGASGLTTIQCGSVNAFRWITAQPGGPDHDCAASGSNNLFGCGTGGTATMTCSILVKNWEYTDCNNVEWFCNDAQHESDVVTKSVLGGGGVICCRG